MHWQSTVFDVRQNSVYLDYSASHFDLHIDNNLNLYLAQIIRVQSPEGMKKITSTKRETAAAFLKKVTQ